MRLVVRKIRYIVLNFVTINKVFKIFISYLTFPTSGFLSLVMHEMRAVENKWYLALSRFDQCIDAVTELTKKENFYAVSVLCVCSMFGHNEMQLCSHRVFTSTLADHRYVSTLADHRYVSMLADHR